MDNNGKKKPGRPKIDIDPRVVEALASKFCTMTEIAAVVGCNVSTIKRRFAQTIARGREKGKMRLRDQQLKSANNGSFVMQIWLGKQYLDQKEKQEVTGALGVGQIPAQAILAQLSKPLPPDEIEGRLEEEQKLLEDSSNVIDEEQGDG